MFKKAAFVLGAAVGFVAGSAAGREPFEKLRETVTGVATDPAVREQVRQGAEKAQATVQENAPKVASAVQDGAAVAKSKVSSKVGKQEGTLPEDQEGSLQASSDSPELKHLG